MFMLHKKFIAVVIALAMCAIQAVPAFACGGLLAPDGDVRLARATTLVAWHNGIERYFTSFTYQGNATNLGSFATQYNFPITSGTVTSI